MADETYTEDQTITVEVDRDVKEDQSTTITIEGTITAHKTLAGGGWSSAQSRWSTVEGGLAALATSYAGGATVRTEPQSKRVTYNELERSIQYTYVFDSGDTFCDEDITVTVALRGEVPDCDVYDVTVEGNLKGTKNDGTSAYDQAKNCYGALDIFALAQAGYTDAGAGGTLNSTPVRTSVTFNEFNGTVGFSYTYNDKASSLTHDTTITVQWSRDSDTATARLEGTITGDCAGDWSDVITEFGTVTVSSAYTDCNAQYDGYYTLCSTPSARSVAKNELGLRITYSYEFSDDPSCAADIDTSVVVRTDPNSCGDYLVNVEGSILGRRTGNDPWTNAQQEYNTNHNEASAKTKAGSYVSGTLHRISKSETFAEEGFRIQYSYEFSNQAEYQIDETITSKWDGEADCGYITTTQEGTVTGLCTGAASSAYTNAQTGFGTVGAPGGAGTQIRNSESHNQKRGTISYSREYTNRSNPYVIDMTETISERLEDCYNTVTIEGTVNGLCENNNQTNKWNNAWTGYNNLTIEPSDSTGTSWVEIRKSIGKNTYAGRVTFSYEFKEESRCVPGALSESIEISEEMESDVFAVVEVIGGPPVIQDKGGSTATTKAINIQIRMPPDCTCDLTGVEPDVESLITAAEPSSTVVVVKTNTKSWNPRTGMYTRQKSWVYGDC